MRFKILTILFLSFLFGGTVLATDKVDLYYSLCNGNANDLFPRGQTFKAAHSNISGVSLYFPSYISGTIDLYVCKGNPDYANIPTTYNCSASGNELVYFGDDLLPTNISTSTFMFSPVDTVVGDNYYLAFQKNSGTFNFCYNLVVPNGYYPNGWAFYSGGSNQGDNVDLSFSTWYDDNPSPPPPTFQINLLTPATTTPFTTYYGQPASYTFNYIDPLHWYPQIRFMVKRKADAKASAWPDYVNSATFWTSAAATSTLTYGSASFQLPDGYYDLDVYFWANIPASPVHTTTTFTVNAGGTYGGYSFATSTLIKPPTFSTEDLCGDIATTTMFGAIECGLTKAFINAITWAFAPSFDTLTNFKVSFELFKGCFPFNTYFQLTDTITNAASSTATSTAGTIKIPFIHTISGGGTFYMLDAISSSTLSNWIGAANYNLFRTTIGYFFWLIAAAVVFFTIKFI